MSNISNAKASETRLMQDNLKKMMADELRLCAELCRENIDKGHVSDDVDDTVETYEKAEKAFLSLIHEFDKAIENSGDDWNATADNANVFLEVTVPWAFKGIFSAKRTNRIQQESIGIVLVKGFDG